MDTCNGTVWVNFALRSCAFGVIMSTIKQINHDVT